MRKIIAVAVAAGTFAAAGQACAHDGGAIVGALLGGAVVGAVVGSAINSPPAVYAPPPPVYVQPGYAQPAYAQPVYAQPVYAAPAYQPPPGYCLDRYQRAYVPCGPVVYNGDAPPPY
jgi:hypothetical protein